MPEPVKKLDSVYICGAYGMLGSDLVKYFSDELGENRVFASDYDTLDITSETLVRKALEDLKPSVVINAAAYTDVDGAERERDKAYLINVMGPRTLAKVCHELGIKLVHFSTDYVFDGSGDRPWLETDATNPPSPNYYAQTKLWGEQEVLANPENLVLRVQWLYGERKDRFTPLRGKQVFTPFQDQYGAPTWTIEICRIVKELLVRDGKGVFHLAYDDYATWAEVYEFVRDELKLSTQLIPKPSSEVKLPARRPLFGAMSNRKLLDFLGWETMGSWKEPLRQFLKDK